FPLHNRKSCKREHVRASLVVRGSATLDRTVRCGEHVVQDVQELREHAVHGVLVVAVRVEPEAPGHLPGSVGVDGPQRTVRHVGTDRLGDGPPPDPLHPQARDRLHGVPWRRGRDLEHPGLRVVHGDGGHQFRCLRHDLDERQVPGERPQAGLLRPGDDLVEVRAPGQIRPQGEEVHEGADRVHEPFLTAAQG
ncbi:hypothetical protein CIT14_21620, partial [Virgibacillus profundi]